MFSSEKYIFVKKYLEMSYKWVKKIDNGVKHWFSGKKKYLA